MKPSQSPVVSVGCRFRIVKSRWSSVVLSVKCCRQEWNRDVPVLRSYWWLRGNFLHPFQLLSKLLLVTEERFATRRSRPMIMKKRTSSQRLHFYRRLKIRSRAAVTGDVMAADVSPHPADAALPVRLQVRPQDVDHGDGFWIIVVIFQL